MLFGGIKMKEVRVIAESKFKLVLEEDALKGD